MPRVEATEKDSFDPLDEGEYNFVIAKATDEVGREEPHNPYVHLQLQEPDTKKNVFENIVFTAKAAFKVSQFWRALGHNVKKGDPIEFEAKDVIGLEVRAHVSIDEWDGKLRNKVDWFIERDEAAIAKNAPSVRQSSKVVSPF